MTTTKRTAQKGPTAMDIASMIEEIKKARRKKIGERDLTSAEIHTLVNAHRIQEDIKATLEKKKEDMWCKLAEARDVDLGELSNKDMALQLGGDMGDIILSNKTPDGPIPVSVVSSGEDSEFVAALDPLTEDELNDILSWSRSAVDRGRKADDDINSFFEELAKKSGFENYAQAQEAGHGWEIEPKTMRAEHWVDKDALAQTN